MKADIYPCFEIYDNAKGEPEEMPPYTICAVEFTDHHEVQTLIEALYDADPFENQPILAALRDELAKLVMVEEGRE